MKINHCMLLALGGLAASFTVSAITLDTFDSFAPGGAGFDLTTGAPTDAESYSGFQTITRRASLPGTGTATFDNNPAGEAVWINAPGASTTATLRYSWGANQNFAAANVNDIEILLGSGSPFSGVDLTISVYGIGTTPNAGTPGFRGVFPNAFSGGPSLTFNVGSFVGINGGSSAIWSSARQIMFTLTTTSGNGATAAIDEINLNAQVPEAKTMLPALGLAGLVGFVAWKRRKGN